MSAPDEVFHKEITRRVVSVSDDRPGRDITKDAGPEFRSRIERVNVIGQEWAEGFEQATLKYQSDGQAQPSRVPRRSHRQLGERINAYRETVTKVINQFRAARLLEIDRSFITLLNPRGLEELAQG